MTTENAAPCARQFSFDMLSAWRDGQLPAKLATEISDHTPHCAACQNTLAEMGLIAQTLRRHDPPNLLTPATQAQLWRALQSTAIKRQGVSPVPISRRTVWRGLSGAIAAALVIVLFMQVFRLNAAVRKTTSVAASPVASPSRVWGPSAVDTIPLVPLGLTTFSATDIAPDGSFVVGLAAKGTDSVPNEMEVDAVGTIDLLTKRYHQLASLPDGGMGVTPVTDGRFIAYQNYTYSAKGPVYKNIILLDTTTQQQTTLGGQDGTTSADLLALDHGTLYWQALTEVTLSQTIIQGMDYGSAYQAPSPLLATDLATHTTRTLLPATNTVNSLVLPIALYQHIERNGQNITLGDLHSLNLSTGQDNIVPSESNNTSTITNAEMLYTTNEGFARGRTSLTIFDKTPTEAGWHQIVTVFANSPQILITNTGDKLAAANDRLIMWDDMIFSQDGNDHLLAWDRVKQTEIDLGVSADMNRSRFFLVSPFARGQWFMYETLVNGANVLNVIDTTRLPGA